MNTDHNRQLFDLLDAAKQTGIILTESYAARSGQSVEQVERWLAPNLGY